MTKLMKPMISAVATWIISHSLPALADYPSSVRVRNISYAGSGCPAGTVAQNLASDFSAFTLLFDQYAAEVGPGVPFSLKRKNCQLNIDLEVPSGWSYTLFSVDTRGYVALQPGVSAIQQSTYYFQGQLQSARLRTTMVGPLDQNYSARDQLGLGSVVWSPCSAVRSLNINTEVRADNSFNPAGQGMITIDSIDGDFKLVYGLRWKRC